MFVLGYDTETTGLDTLKDSIVEVGAVVWCTEKNIPIHIFSTFINDADLSGPQVDEALLVNKIEKPWLSKGMSFSDAMEEINSIIAKYSIEYIIAHNGENFDKPITIENIKRRNPHKSYYIEKLPWIDTRQDIPFEKEPPSRKLVHLCAEHGFVNLYSHRAVFDVLSMLKLMSFYSFVDIIRHSKVPWIVVRALVDYDNREKAKKARFMWEAIGDKKYPKMWVKKIKEDYLETEIKKASLEGFKVVRIE